VKAGEKKRRVREIAKTEVDMSKSSELIKFVEGCKAMARGMAERDVAEGREIDLTKLDSTELRDLVHGTVEVMEETEDGQELLNMLAEGALVAQVVKAFAERVQELRRN
jgi:hypothetical protein